MTKEELKYKELENVQGGKLWVDINNLNDININDLSDGDAVVLTNGRIYFWDAKKKNWDYVDESKDQHAAII